MISCAIGDYTEHLSSYGVRVAVRDNSEEEFALYNGDSDSMIRFKFIGLLAYHLPGGVMQLAYRVVDLLTLGFYFRAIAETTANHNFTMGIHPELRGTKPDSLSQAANVVSHLVWDVVKLILFPLSVILREGIAAFGLLFPHDARKYYAMVERWFERPPSDIYKPASVFEYYGNYAAYCMQPVKHWTSQNLFRLLPSNKYFPENTRVQWTRLAKAIAVLKRLFPHNPTVVNIESLLPAIKQSIEQTKVTPIQESMLHSEGTPHTRLQAISRGLQEVRALLEEAYANYVQHGPQDFVPKSYALSLAEAEGKLQTVCS